MARTAFGKEAAKATREFRALHDGLAPPTMREETVHTGEPVVAVLGKIPEFRYWKLVRVRGAPTLDLYRHFNLEEARKEAGLIRSLSKHSSALPGVLARLPSYGVSARGELVVLGQKHTFVTDRGIEDRPAGSARRLRADGSPFAPTRLVSLGPLPEIRWLDAQGRVHRHVFFADLQDRAPAVAASLLPLLAHDGRGNVFVVRQSHIRVARDGTIEETMTTSRVPHANPTTKKNTQKGIVRHTSSSSTVQRVEARPVEQEPVAYAKDLGKSVLAAVAGVVASGFVLRRTSLSTSERAAVTAVGLGATGFLLRNKTPNVALGLALGGGGAAAIPLFDSARVAYNTNTVATQTSTSTIAAAGPAAGGAPAAGADASKPTP